MLTAIKPPKFLLTHTVGNFSYGYASAHKARMRVWQVDKLHLAIHTKELAAVVMGLAINTEDFTNHPMVI